MAILINSCVDKTKNSETPLLPPRVPAQVLPEIMDLKKIINLKVDKKLPQLIDLPKDVKEVDALIAEAKIPAQKTKMAKEKLISYFEFLGVDPRTPSGFKIVQRIFNSSTMFLFCDYEDWGCLEQKPWIVPQQKWRQDLTSDLGKPVLINHELKYKFFFTEQFDIPLKDRDLHLTMATKLSDILQQKWEQIFIAIYGIDDIDGTMKNVYQNILDQVKKGTEVNAVFDSEGFEPQKENGKILFSYQGIQAGDLPSDLKSGWSPSKLSFQYDGTYSLLKELNAKARDEDETKAHFEWPDSGIMHNKFFIFKNKKNAAVWLGTANISQACMGNDTNANMALFVEEPEIVKSYENEFNEMFNFSKEYFKDPKKKIFNADGSLEIPVGKYHKKKSPNTKRYFKFSDGTEVRVHFSPTDDAEHRVLIPLLLSALPEDEIRISMFGTGGVELVRAIQYAASVGAHIRIAFDNMQSSVPGSWLNSEVSLKQNNPFLTKNTRPIELGKSWWPGLNHHKTATLTRKNKLGDKVVHTLIVGSQNWSTTGNDESDENMMTLRNAQKGVKAG